MAKRRKRKASNPHYPGWVWMLFGLSIGLSVALAIYVNDRTSVPPARSAGKQPAGASTNVPSAVDDNPEKTRGVEEQRFTFYDMLPNFEVIIPDLEPDVAPDIEPQAIVDPGVYVLQAGSFSTYTDADRRRANLALQGIESRIQRVTIDDRTYHRVRIGPIDDLDELNVLRRRLRTAGIDVLRIKLGD